MICIRIFFALRFLPTTYPKISIISLSSLRSIDNYMLYSWEQFPLYFMHRSIRNALTFLTKILAKSAVNVSLTSNWTQKGCVNETYVVLSAPQVIFSPQLAALLIDGQLGPVISLAWLSGCAKEIVDSLMLLRKFRLFINLTLQVSNFCWNAVCTTSSSSEAIRRTYSLHSCSSILNSGRQTSRLIDKPASLT